MENLYLGPDASWQDVRDAGSCNVCGASIFAHEGPFTARVLVIDFRCQRVRVCPKCARALRDLLTCRIKQLERRTKP